MIESTAAAWSQPPDDVVRVVHVVGARPQWWRGLLTAASYTAASLAGAVTVGVLWSPARYEAQTPSSDPCQTWRCPAVETAPETPPTPTPAALPVVANVHHESSDKRFLALYELVVPPVLDPSMWIDAAIRLGRQQCTVLARRGVTVGEAAEALHDTYTVSLSQAYRVVDAAESSYCPRHEFGAGNTDWRTD